MFCLFAFSVVKKDVFGFLLTYCVFRRGWASQQFSPGRRRWSVWGTWDTLSWPRLWGLRLEPSLLGLLQPHRGKLSGNCVYVLSYDKGISQRDSVHRQWSRVPSSERQGWNAYFFKGTPMTCLASLTINWLRIPSAALLHVTFSSSTGSHRRGRSCASLDWHFKDPSTQTV